MSYMVTAYDTKIIDLAPGTVVKEVLQNVTMIISTPQFTVPLDRKFGLNQRFVDKPIPIAQTMIIGDVMDAIESYEPRAEVVGVTFIEATAGGKLVPRAEVNIIGG